MISCFTFSQKLPSYLYNLYVALISSLLGPQSFDGIDNFFTLCIYEGNYVIYTLYFKFSCIYETFRKKIMYTHTHTHTHTYIYIYTE